MGNWTPSIVPNPDQTVYLVLDDNPVRVVGFNAAEGWARDVSADVADELRGRCGLEGAGVPAYLEAFVHRHDRAQRRLG